MKFELMTDSIFPNFNECYIFAVISITGILAITLRSHKTNLLFCKLEYG